MPTSESSFWENPLKGDIKDRGWRSTFFRAQAGFPLPFCIYLAKMITRNHSGQTQEKNE